MSNPQAAPLRVPLNAYAVPVPGAKRPTWRGSRGFLFEVVQSAADFFVCYRVPGLIPRTVLCECSSSAAAAEAARLYSVRHMAEPRSIPGGWSRPERAL